MSSHDTNRNKRPAPQSYGGESSPSQNVEEPRKRRAPGMNNAPDPLFDDPVPTPTSALVPAGYYGAQLLEPTMALPGMTLPSMTAAGPQESSVGGLGSIAPILTTPHTLQPPILVAGYTLLELGVAIPNWVPPEEALRRQQCIVGEMEYQRNNPPALPPSRVPGLPPKEDLPDYVDFPDGVNEETRRIIEKKNNQIASEIQRIERQRNNMAAKKSRALRLEARDDYRELLIEARAEQKLIRLVLAAHGFDPAMWNHLDPGVAQGLLDQTRREADAVDAHMAELKKREVSRKRIERIQAKNALRAEREAAEAAALEQGRPFPAAEDGQEIFQVVSPEVGEAAVDADTVEYLQVVSPRLGGQELF